MELHSQEKKISSFFLCIFQFLLILAMHSLKNLFWLLQHQISYCHMNDDGCMISSLFIALF